MGAFITRAQVDTVSIYDIQYVSPATLQACEDSSFYENKIVHFEGIISVDGNLSEVVSGSITGGSRPFINVVDTANGGQGGPFMGVDMMGVIDGTSDPYPGFENLLAGDRIRATCLVASFDGETQFTPISSTAIQIISSGAAPSPLVSFRSITRVPSRRAAIGVRVGFPSSPQKTDLRRPSKNFDRRSSETPSRCFIVYPGALVVFPLIRSL